MLLYVHYRGCFYTRGPKAVRRLAFRHLQDTQYYPATELGVIVVLQIRGHIFWYGDGQPSRIGKLKKII